MIIFKPSTVRIQMIPGEDPGILRHPDDELIGADAAVADGDFR